MDLQKEREAFEVLQNPKILQRAEFLVNISAYAIINEYRDNLFTLEWVEELNFGWRMWKAAKAQAVPEGFVLVPKESLKVAISWMDEDIDPWQMSVDSFSELFEHKPILEKAMIEAAEKEVSEAREQSHD